MTPRTINVSGFVPESITDGPGIRFVIFAQGCPHACVGCHNQETWPFEGGMLYEIEDIFDQIRKNPLIKGVTFSGGEPFSQAVAFTELAKKLKDSGYEIAVYTGYTFEELYNSDHVDWQRLLRLTDVLIDGRFEQPLRDLNLQFRGSSNQRILNVANSLEEKKPIADTTSRWVGEQAE